MKDTIDDRIIEALLGPELTRKLDDYISREMGGDPGHGSMRSLAWSRPSSDRPERGSRKRTNAGYARRRRQAGRDRETRKSLLGRLPRWQTSMTALNFAESMFERLALFVLWCVLALVVISLRRRLSLLQKEIDELSHDVRLLESAESRRLMESLNSSGRSNPGAPET
jgi:hypothetical protein